MLSYKSVVICSKVSLLVHLFSRLFEFAGAFCSWLRVGLGSTVCPNFVDFSLLARSLSTKSQISVSVQQLDTVLMYVTRGAWLGLYL